MILARLSYKLFRMKFYFNFDILKLLVLILVDIDSLLLLFVVVVYVINLEPAKNFLFEYDIYKLFYLMKFYLLNGFI